MPHSLGHRWQRLVVKRPRGHLHLLISLKATEIAGDLTNRALRRRAGGRFALVRSMPRHSAIAEVGVWRGGFSGLLKDVLAPRQLILVDPWSDAAPNVPWQGPSAKFQDTGQIFEDAYREVVDRFGSDPAVTIVRAPSLDAARDIPDRSLDVVYIDGAHTYEDVCADLRAWSPKVRAGGWLTGDDYYWSRDGGQTFPVRRAVDEFIRETRPNHWAVFRGQFMVTQC